MSGTIERKRELIARLEDNYKKRDKCLRELALWVEVEAQGFSPDDVAGLTLVDKWLTPEQRRTRQAAICRHGVDPYLRDGELLIYNAVLLKSGEIRPLASMLAAP